MLAHGTFATTSLDRNTLPQSKLDVKNRVRTNLLPWTGQFSPQLVEELLLAFGPRTGIVMDPFVGSGTSLVEAARLGFTASGSDLNPAAVVLARVYRMINLGAKARESLLDEMRTRLFQTVGVSDGPLFFQSDRGSQDRIVLENALVSLWHECDPGALRDLAAALIVLSDFHRKHLDTAAIHKTWLRIERTVRSLPMSPHVVTAQQADARALPFESDSVDFIITSPPYINVHNYHQKFRRSVEALNWDILALSRSEIGSNRQNRGNRFLTVIQYSLDMTLALLEMARILRRGTRLVLVLGRESSVRGVRFFNGELVTDLAAQCVGFEIERRQERMFRNRFGTRIYEDIVHFRATNEVPDRKSSMANARCVAKQTLLAARSQTTSEIRLGIEAALAQIDSAMPSPALFPTNHSSLFV